MKCLNCGSSEQTHVSSAAYQYVASGLDNVYLKGLNITKCKKCGEEEINIPNLEELHELIATDVAKQIKKLSGKEIRFLRVHLGWSGKDFARRLGVSHENVSRWETEKHEMSNAAEAFLRLAILAQIAPVRNYDFLPDGTKRPKHLTLKRTFTIRQDHWTLKAA